MQNKKSKIVKPNILIDITSLRNVHGDISLNETRDAIYESGGAAVRKVKDGHALMAIGGDISYRQVKNIFEKLNGIDIEEFVSAPRDWTSKYKPINEKRKDCCSGRRNNKPAKEISLAEALENKKANRLGLNQIIDGMNKNTLENKMMEHAINKALAEKNLNITKKDSERFVKINEALIAGKTSLHGNTKINEKKICDYTMEEMEELVEKLNSHITSINNKMAVITEGEKIQNLKEQLAKYERCLNIIKEEIEYRKVIAEKECKDGKCDECDECEKKPLKEDEEGGLDFPDLNPNSSDDEDKSDDSEKSDEDDNDENSEESEDGEYEEIELSSVVITLADKNAAEDLKNDLIDVGVPEEDIEVASANEDESDEEDENSEEGEEETTEETDEDIDDVIDDEEGLLDEPQEESEKSDVKGDKLTEADGDDENAEADAAGDDADNADVTDGTDEPAEGEEESEEGEYKLTLTNTDYIDELKDVLMNRWGVTEEEFTDLIGGEIVGSEDGENEDSDENNSEDDSDEGSDDSEDKEEESDDKKEKKDDKEDDMSFDPDEIFKGM